MAAVGTLLTKLACLCLPHLACGAVFRQSASQNAAVTAYSLPELDFPYDALEGVFVGSQTMHLHHDKHHALYVNTLNKAMAGSKKAGTDIELLIQQIQELPRNIRGVVRNHGGGHLNHALFWRWLKPGGGPAPKGAVKARIDKDFGSFEKFQAAFEAAAVARFGSGWVWLVVEEGNAGEEHLRVCSTANQDNPVMDVDIGNCHGTPLLGLDVWEHAYYLDYFNVRPKYVKAFWKVANWDTVEERFAKAKAMPKKEHKEHSAAGLARLGPVVAFIVIACRML